MSKAGGIATLPVRMRALTKPCSAAIVPLPLPLWAELALVATVTSTVQGGSWPPLVKSRTRGLHRGCNEGSENATDGGCGEGGALMGTEAKADEAATGHTDAGEEKEQPAPRMLPAATVTDEPKSVARVTAPAAPAPASASDQSEAEVWI